MKDLAMFYMLAAIAEEPQGRYYDVERIKPKPKPQSEVAKEKGLKLFEFQDGFYVYALNQKNANKKHEAYLKKQL